MFALKGIVLRQVLDGGWNKHKLIRDKGIASNEVILIPIVAVGLGAIGKVEQRFEVVDLLVIYIRQLR